MNLQDEIEQLLWLPGTVNELSAILDKPRRSVHATLHNLKKLGKAKVLTHRREERRGPPSAIWGRPSTNHIGWIDTNKPAHFRGHVSVQSTTRTATPFPAQAGST